MKPTLYVYLAQKMFSTETPTPKQVLTAKRAAHRSAYGVGKGAIETARLITSYFKGEETTCRYTHIAIILGKTNETVELWFDKNTDRLFINGNEKKEIPT